MGNAAETPTVIPAFDNTVYYEDQAAAPITTGHAFAVQGVIGVGGVPLRAANTNDHATLNSSIFVEAQFCSPLGANFANYSLGEILPAPPGVDLSVPPTINGDNLVWIDYAQSLLAVDGGAAIVTWTLQGGGDQTTVYTVSPNPSRRPVRIYWTSKQNGAPAQNAGPQIKFGSNYRVDLYPNSQIVINDKSPLDDYGFTTNWAYLSDPATNIPDVWIENNSLNAREGASGKFLLTYSSIDNATGNRQLLAYEVVDVLQPVSATLDRNVGDRLLPVSDQYPTDELFAEITRGALDESGGDEVFVYKHEDGIQKGWVWGIRETDGPAQVEIFWKAKEELDVIWPFEVDVYDLTWGGSNVQEYARSSNPLDPGPEVYFDAAYTLSILPAQKDGLIGDHAYLTPEGNFASLAEGYCLLRYDTEDYIWFQAVQSVTNTPKTVRDQDIADALRPFDTNTYGMWPGYIYAGRPYHPGFYSYPGGYPQPGAESDSEIYGVNTGRVEVWWFEPSVQPVMPSPTYWPTAKDLVDFQWPADAPEIVISSGLGSEGLTMSTNGYRYMADVSPTSAVQVTGSENLLSFTGDFTLETWVRPEGLQNAAYLFSKTNNYQLAITNNYLVAHIQGLPPLYASEPLKSNTWQHVAVRVSSAEGVAIYLDGAMQGHAMVTGAIQDVSFAMLQIGQGFTGNLDELRVWSFARSEDDLRKYMRAPVSDVSPGLELYYRFSRPPKPAQPWTEAHYIPGTIEAEDFSSYYDVDVGNNGNSNYRAGEDVDINTIAADTNQLYVGWTSPGEWLGYSFHAPKSGWYYLAYTLATPNADRSLFVYLNDDYVGSVNMGAGTGGWESFYTYGGWRYISSGNHTLFLVAGQGGFNIDKVRITDKGFYYAPSNATFDETTNKLHGLAFHTAGGRPYASDGVSMLGLNPSLYLQNDDPDGIGYNPNEEHAFTLSDTVHALRTNYNGESTSEPFVLVEHDGANGGREMTAYRVVLSNELYGFNQYLDAGLMIQAPSPLVYLYPSWAPTNTLVSGPDFKDRTGRYWAYKAGDDGGPESYVFNLFYPNRPEFWHSVNPPPADGELLRWESSPGELIDYTYRVTWPLDAPTLYIADTLTAARNGLPAVRGQLSVDLLYQQSMAATNQPSVHLVDPTAVRTASLAEIPAGMKTQRDPATGFTFFSELPPALRERLYYNPFASPGEELQLKGRYIERTDGFNYLQLNVLDATNLAAATDSSLISGTTPAWDAAISQLAAYPILTVSNDYTAVDSYALSTAGEGEGFVTLVMNNSTNLDMVDPSEVVGMEIIQVRPPLFNGRIDLVLSQNPLDQKVNAIYTADFAGQPSKWEFKWEYADPENGQAPDETNDAAWLAFDLGSGLNGVTIGDSGAFGLSDHYLRCTYRALDTNVQALVGTNFVSWTPPQLVEGWIKRVLKAINPFDQRIKDYMNYEILTDLSMIQQAGEPYNGNVPLNYDVLNEEGLIPFYQTILVKARDLTIDANIPAQNALSLALLMSAGRLNDLYMVLGNEAYSDALNPTLNLGVGDATYGSAAPSIFSFQNQLPSLLEEELALLRGRDDSFNPPVTAYPVYNRLAWNMTYDISGGQPAYILNYGIADENLDGNVDELDAQALYPQGHGDAWGHYLAAVKGYYELLRNDYFTWLPQVEGLLVGDLEVTISYLHEKKFAVAAAAKSKAGASIVAHEARRAFTVGEEPWETALDTDLDRAWGPAEWGSRAAMGSYFDWLTVNTLLPSVDDPGKTGIEVIDRQTTPELAEISKSARNIQAQVDSVDAGETPLGLSEDAVPFDISPAGIDAGDTHFEQIYARAKAALTAASDIFDRSTELTAALRDQNENLDHQRAVQEDEEGTLRKLIELYGYPYSDDIGPGKIYPQDYNGPDLVNYMYIERSDLLDRVSGITREVVFTNSAWVLTGNQETTFPQASLEALFESANGNLEATNTASVLYNYAYANDDPEGPWTSTLQVLTLSSPEWTQQQYEVAQNLGPYGIPVKPETYTGSRRAAGRIQLAISALFEEIDRTYQAYDTLEAESEKLKLELVSLEARADYLTAESSLKAFIKGQIRDQKQTTETLKAIAAGLKDGALLSFWIANAVADNIPGNTPTAGLSVSLGDAFSVGRGGIKMIGAVVSGVLQASANGMLGRVAQINKDLLDMDYELGRSIGRLNKNEEQLQDLLNLRKSIQDLRAVVSGLDAHHQAVETARMQLSSLIAEGDYLQVELGRLRANHAADLTQKRYRNMAYRVFQNDALARYHEAFETAARYVYLAAKAYDYETGLLASDAEHTAGREFMEDIVKARALGAFTDEGEPLPGAAYGDPGLADIMARMHANWQVLDGRLSFNNPQTETGRFSLRQELFRISPDASSDVNWRNTLENYRVGNLLDIPEFKRYCLPFDPVEQAEPGLVIPFSTEINFRKNFFGNGLAGGDNAYDSSHFATKIRSVGVWFSNFDNAYQDGIANQPRVYLLPVGADQMRVPSDTGEEIRSWRVVDHALPVPYPISQGDWDQPDWSALKDMFGGDLFNIRRHPSLRAYHDSGNFSEAEMINDSRLVGRSVWNTKWLLIIPGGTLLENADEGIERFIHGQEVSPGIRDENGVKDIKLFFQTYSYSGN